MPAKTNKVSYWLLDHNKGQLVATMPGHKVAELKVRAVASKLFPGMEWTAVSWEANGYVTKPVTKPKVEPIAMFGGSVRKGGLQ